MANNNIKSFPQEIDNILDVISKTYRLCLRKETHYEALNRELSCFRKNSLYRLDFDLKQQEGVISVTLHKDKFPIFPQLLVWCHNFLPFFPYVARQEWRHLPGLPIGLEKEEYIKRIKQYVNEIKALS